ncbi:MAG: hypothetical protein GC155_08685 [Alphaproteobacteria bacterium]|nr:hypothetical protein [Alphaproteobacteria bacterium]
MTLSITLARMLAVTVCAAGVATAASAEPRYQGPLDWMVGCWETADHASVQVWSEPVGGVMFGYATTMKDGALAFFEQDRIDLRNERPSYSVSPDGDRWVAFVAPPPKPPELDKRGRPLPPAEVATFENSSNAYPQRIQYRSDGRRGLSATISNLDGSRTTELSWEKCR